MFSKRVQIQLIIGSDTITRSIIQKVLEKLSEKYGGSTLIDCEGQWATNGSAFVDFYGKMVSEAAYMILLTMVPEALDMEYIMAACLPLHGMADWIHVEKHETEAAHFSLKALANLTTVTN